MNYIIRDKKFYMTMLGMMLPIALQNMITTGVGIMDTVMLGSFGDATLSGASLANQMSFFLMIIVFGMSSGAGVLISQYSGRGNREAVGRIIGIAMRFVFGISLIFTVVGLTIPEQVMTLFNKDPEVVALGASYIRTVAFAYIPSSIVSCYLISLRSVGKAGFSTIVYGLSFFVNVFFNYCFIFGKLGFPALGIVGAAIGTVIARCFEFIVVISYVYFFDRSTDFKFGLLFKKEPNLTKDYLSCAMPVTGSEFVWSLGTLVTAAIVGNIGTAFVAANSIAGIVQQLGMVMMFGVANATAVTVGKATGRGEYGYAKKVSVTMLIMSLIVGVLACGIVLAARGPLLSIYRVSAEAGALAYNIMGAISVLIILSGPEITSIIGVLRGGGDTKTAFLIDCGSMWLVSVPLGLVAGFLLKLPPLTVYILMRFDLPVRLTLCLIRIFKGKFLKNVTRDSI